MSEVIRPNPFLPKDPALQQYVDLERELASYVTLDLFAPVADVVPISTHPKFKRAACPITGKPR